MLSMAQASLLHFHIQREGSICPFFEENLNSLFARLFPVLVLLLGSTKSDPLSEFKNITQKINGMKNCKEYVNGHEH
jgi:hypothetical protein